MSARSSALRQSYVNVSDEIEQYVKTRQVDSVVEDMISSLLKAKPDNPRAWLLEKLEKDLSDQSDELSESDLHRLFAVTRKITAEIVPKDTINMVILETMQILNCDIVSLFVLEKKSGMLLLYASNLDNPIKVNPGQGIAGTVFNSKETVNIPDCYKDSRFDRSFDKRSGYITKSLIAVPIIDYEQSCCGVIQAINKMPRNEKAEQSSRPAGARAIPFEGNDEKLLMHLTQHVAIAMRNADVYREAIGSTERATGLLNTILSLSQDLGTQSLLLTITMHANKIVSAERSTVFLVDEPHGQLWSVSTDTGQEIRIPKRAGIAGQCCCEGKFINIPDAYADSRFNQDIDKKTGFKTQSILAVPMFDDGLADTSAANARRSLTGGPNHNVAQAPHGPKVIGVIQMINKVSYDGQLEFFDETDIEVMELFAKFVGPKLTKSEMLGKRGSVQDAATEADIGLRKVPDQLSGASPYSEPSTHKRMSNTPMALPEGAIEENPNAEEEEQEEEEEEN
eukprot:TRINITY_DN555_c0_g2_i1.p1 TRINITY_DN555_c0_g2~~TRINITY_DN555_c0_g2_i1.p1  ORF type:complete len:509 (-),score=123.83 TRINITY_DN555_c0_g2_i1:23-1549(-)